MIYNIIKFFNAIQFGVILSAAPGPSGPSKAWDPDKQTMSVGHSLLKKNNMNALAEHNLFIWIPTFAGPCGTGAAFWMTPNAQSRGLI